MMWCLLTIIRNNPLFTRIRVWAKFIQPGLHGLILMFSLWTIIQTNIYIGVSRQIELWKRLNAYYFFREIKLKNWWHILSLCIYNIKGRIFRRLIYGAYITDPVIIYQTYLELKYEAIYNIALFIWFSINYVTFYKSWMFC